MTDNEGGGGSPVSSSSADGSVRGRIWPPLKLAVCRFQLKYKRRVYKMLHLDEKQLRSLHTRVQLRRFLDYVAGGQAEKITKICAKGLDPNFHCQETGGKPRRSTTFLARVFLVSRRVSAALSTGFRIFFRGRCPLGIILGIFSDSDSY